MHVRKIITYTNGNATITLHSDGTRIIDYDGTLQLDYPLNIDIRVQTKCPLGYNPKTKQAICTFCHESATTDGDECDYVLLLSKLDGLPAGIELAIGCNMLTPGLYRFLFECKNRGYICNLTVNQVMLHKYIDTLKAAAEGGLIRGLGVSYRKFNDVVLPKYILDYENTVFHVICGIDDIEDIIKLRDVGVRKILILGEKDFGFNVGCVDLTGHKHKQWFYKVNRLFKLFEVVAFDNLAIEQLNIKRFIPQDSWCEFYQGEYSFYINAVTGKYSRSSRSSEVTDWDNITIQQYFRGLKLCNL
jgi:hypothetical protein